MDKRDLLNLCRHAFLIGFNEGRGYEMYRENGIKHEIAVNAAFDCRDEDLNSFIEEYLKEGYMTYKDDMGSYTCNNGCKVDANGSD
jgi:hypothetical protein